MTQINSPLRKGRYVQLSKAKHLPIAKIKDSKVCKIPVIGFNIFNIPVECIEIDNVITIHHTDSIQVENVWSLDNSMLESLHITVYNSKLYTPLSELKFPLNADKQTFVQLKKARGL